MTKSKDHLDCKKRQLEMSKQLDIELSVLVLTSQPSATATLAIALPPYNAEGGSTEMRPKLAPYSDGDIHMGNINDSVTDDLYQ